MFNGTQLEYPYSAQVFESLFRRVMPELPEGLKQLLSKSNDVNQKIILVVKYIFEYRLTECTPELLKTIIKNGELLGMDFGAGSKKAIDQYKEELYEFYLRYFNFEGGPAREEVLEEFEFSRDYLEQLILFVESTTNDTWQWISESYLYALDNVEYRDQSDHFHADNAERRAAQLDLYLTRYGELRSLFIEAYMDEADLVDLERIYVELRKCVRGIIREIFDLDHKEAGKIAACIFDRGVILDMQEIGEFRMILSDNDLDYEIPKDFVVVTEKDYGDLLKSLGYEWSTERDLNDTEAIAEFLFGIDLYDDIADNPSLQYMLDGDGHEFVTNSIAAAKRYTFFRLISLKNSLGAVVNLCDDDYIYKGDDKSDDYDGEQ